jgi:hypothetical protein
MVQQVVGLYDPDSSQTVAEALLYGCLSSELTKRSADAILACLKGLVEIGYARELWDFTPTFDRVLPAISPERQALYKALGAAIIDADRVAELDTFDVWRVTVPTDPFAPFPTQ